jgi:predicted regulator of Ras-like GTPase activity (Roadblock/LC7/MglB family)
VRKSTSNDNSNSISNNHQKYALVEERLRLLHTNTPEIAASIIVSNDGITIASALPASVKETRVSAMTAAMLSLGERIADELDRGMLDQIYIKGKIGHVVLMSIGGKAVLTTIARENAKIGLLFLDLQRAALDLEKLI